MLLLIDDINASYGLIAYFAVYKFMVFGCVDSEDRRLKQRRKRGCKSRHILLSPNPPSSEYLTMLGFEKCQSAVSRQSSLDGLPQLLYPSTIDSPVPVLVAADGRLAIFSLLKTQAVYSERTLTNNFS